MTEFDFISPVRTQLEEGLHQHCVTFMLIGTRRETPRYFNQGEIDWENQRFKIESTQNSNLFFWVDAPDEDYLWARSTATEEAWRQFRIFRTEFLLEYYPTIDPY